MNEVGKEVTNELKVEFARLMIQNNVNNLGGYRRWAAKPENREARDKYEKVAEVMFGKVVLAHTGTIKRGKKSNFLPRDEFMAWYAEQKFASISDYRRVRENMTLSQRERYPFDPIGVYSALKIEQE
jgi:hypothetical protein